MATTITNQATISYNYGEVTATATSNVATTVLQGALTITKNSVYENYGTDSDLVYMISVTNSGDTAINALNVTDDLGTYTVTAGTTATPLTYIGPAQLYINGVFSGNIEGTAGSSNVQFTIPTLGAGATAQILYRVKTNEFAPLSASGTITNTASTTPAGGETVTASLTIGALNAADVRIFKSMSPNPVLYGGTLTYTFDIYNYGNVAATDVVLTDTFDPAPANITVTVNGTQIPAANYTYTGGLLTLPTGGELALTVPAATFTASPATGEITVDPGTVRIVVTGTV